MAKVYIVTSGSYSDYSIARAFSTEALAKEWLGDNTEQDYDGYSIEEYELDDLSGKEKNIKSHYRINMNLDGTVTLCKPDFPSDTAAPFIYIRTKYSHHLGPYIDMLLNVSDEKTALKTASEIRARMVALNPQGAEAGEYDYETCQIKNSWAKKNLWMPK